MIIFKQKLSGLLLLCLLAFYSNFALGQTVELKGKIKKDNKPLGGVTIQVTGNGVAPQTITSKENGGFSIVLDLQKSYSVTFIKSGHVSKLIEFNTKVPADVADILYQFDFKIDLFDDLAGVSNNNAMLKPVARVAYNPTYENFMDDENYTKQVRNEQENARKIAEEIIRKQEKIRLDSLNKSWNDSLAKAKSRDSQSLADKAQQERLRLEKEKARRDSIDKVNSLAQEAVKEKARLEAEAKLKEKQKQEAELAASLAAKAKQKAIDDSTQKAQADAKALADAKAKEDKDRLESEAKLKEKQRLEAEQAASLAAKEKAQAEAKALSEAKAKEEKDRLEAEAKLKEKQRLEAEQLAGIAAKEKAIADAKLLQDKKAQNDKVEQERKAKLLAEIEAKKQMLAKANSVEEKSKPLPKTAPIPKIVDSDYRDGVTEETITEANRVIYRTVIKKEGLAFNYQKIVYSWGGIFYFRNESSVTEISFNQDINNAKEKK